MIYEVTWETLDGRVFTTLAYANNQAEAIYNTMACYDDFKDVLGAKQR